LIPPDLAIRMSHDRDFTVGDQAVYTVTVTNVGLTETAGNVTVTDVLPPGLTYRTGKGNGRTCPAAEQVVAWTNPVRSTPELRAPSRLRWMSVRRRFPGESCRSDEWARDRHTSNDTVDDPRAVLLGLH
jgi:uncharacterized repeat protein (TIGR01451 family)